METPAKRVIAARTAETFIVGFEGWLTCESGVTRINRIFTFEVASLANEERLRWIWRV